MESRQHHPLLIAVLRRTLEQIEDELGSAEDRALLELKASIMRILARIEIPESAT